MTPRASAPQPPARRSAESRRAAPGQPAKPPTQAAPVPRHFRRAINASRALAGVELAVRYDGAPVLRLGGCFLAGLAMHASAEPHSLVVRADEEVRATWIDEAPDVYYVTEYYARYPLVLVRLPRIDDAALRDVLATSWRLTRPKARGRPTYDAQAGSRQRRCRNGAAATAR